MDPTVSVSKGVFLFRNGYQKSKSVKKKSKRSLFETLFTKEPWYITFRKNWDRIEYQLKDLHQMTYSMLLCDIVNYMNSIDWNQDEDMLEAIIPCATLLIGVNQPDHVNQFTALNDIIRTKVTPHVAMVSSQDAQTEKHLVENVVWQLIHGAGSYDSLDDSAVEEVESHRKTKLKKSQCTMKVLQKWYNTKYPSTPDIEQYSLVVIMPDFESFNCNILQDFVSTTSSYRSKLPIIFVFGVATSVSVLHKSFPYNVSSKLLIKVFHSHSNVYINEVLENIFLTHTSPFHLSGKAFELLMDVFLFYDFSITGLIQSVKYCFMDHCYGDNSKALCCERGEIEEVISYLNAEELENIRQLPSFRPYLEMQDCRMRIALFEDDNVFRKTLIKEMNHLHDYLHSFYVCVRLLLVFVKDIPKNILGKSVREIYAKCAVNCITETAEFKECMQLINFQSQVNLVESLNNAVKVVDSSLKLSPKSLRLSPVKREKYMNNDTDQLGESFLKSLRVHLLTFLRQIENASNETTVFANDVVEAGSSHGPGNRYKLKEKLLKATRVDKIQSEFEMVRSRFVSYLEDTFRRGLQPPRSRPFNEIVFFSDVSNVKKHIVGSPRGAIHTALSSPVQYLQCSCCELPAPDSVSRTLPDVCLAYTLHRECGKHINLYDWLQAFVTVLQPDHDDDDRLQDSSLHLRFTRAVAELQFLGFIKSSKRKTDHVMRLTW